MASTSSSSSSSSHIYIPSCYPLISNEESERINSIYGRKDDGKESDPDKRELRISDIASLAMMSCVPSRSPVVTTTTTPIRRFPTATTLSPVEVWDLAATPYECVISKTPPATTETRHNVGKLTSSPEFQTCFDNVEFINRFFFEVFSINPIQSATRAFQVKMPKLDPQYPNNAYWHPVDECVYVTHRNPALYNPMEANLGIIAHEFGHAMIHYSSRFDYQNQSGSLHEHGADVVGIMIKHYRSRQLAAAQDTDWRIGEGIYVTEPTHSIRSMSRPGTASLADIQPSHFREVPDSFTEVHRYCGIPNKAFYLTASKLGGHSWERAGRIWVTALQEATQYETFEMFSQRTAAVTKRIYGEREFDIVKKSWYDVGVCTRDWEMIRNLKEDMLQRDRVDQLDVQFWNKYPLLGVFPFFSILQTDFHRQRSFKNLEKIYYPIRLNVDGLSAV